MDDSNSTIARIRKAATIPTSAAAAASAAGSSSSFLSGGPASEQMVTYNSVFGPCYGNANVHSAQSATSSQQGGGAHDIEEEFSTLCILCAIFTFPAGIICCCAFKERRCKKCGKEFQ